MSSPPLINITGGTIPTATFNQQPESSSPSPSGTTLSPSFLTVILIISVTIIISTSLCLLLRYLRTRYARRNRSSATIAYIENTVSHRDRPISSRRVTPENEEHLIESLPTFKFNSLSSGNGSLTGGDCAVCLSKFEPDDMLRLLPICCHAFHAECVDTWIKSNQTCPLCRSSIFATEAEILSKVIASSGNGNRSFRIEIGNVSRRQQQQQDVVVNSSTELHRRSYSIGSFDYVVEDESQIVVASSTRHYHARGLSETTFSDKDDTISPASKPVSCEFPGPSLAGEVGSGRSRLREYADRFSLSFRGSGRFFTGSSRRSTADATGTYDVEANRAGEEISEFFRWFSGV